MAIALHHSRAKGAAKVILLGIANHCGDGGAWPSMATLAKYGNCNVRNAQQSVKRLEELGEVKRYIAAGGNDSTADHMRPNLYQFTLVCPSTCDGTTRHRTRSALAFDMEALRPLSLATPPVAGDTRPLSLATPPVAGDTRPLSPATPEPSSNQLPTDINKARALKRAREAEKAAYGAVQSNTADAVIPAHERCPKRTEAPHAYSRAGECIDCGAHAGENTNTETGASS